MLLGGIQKFSLLDYPNKIACIVFTQGCNFRCRFCYNPTLVVAPPAEGAGKDYHKEALEKGAKLKNHPFLREDDFLIFLKARRGKLDGVVITGGEPTIHSDLPEFIGKIKDLGFMVKLDTNGTNPAMLKDLVDKKLADYIAMDLKSTGAKYHKTAGVKVDLDKIKKSIKIIKESGLPHEFRTTIVPGLIVKSDLEEMGEMIKGADRWCLQQFKSDIPLVDSEFEGTKAYAHKELEEMRQIALKYVKDVDIR